MTLLIVKCGICDEQIATAKKSDLSVPLTGQMFGPPFPERMRHSLLTHTQWEYLKCPTCGNNPFLRDDEVMTPDGIYQIPSEIPPPITKPIDTFTTKFICECCDPPKEYDDKKNRDRHTAMRLRWKARREANKNEG